MTIGETCKSDPMLHFPYDDHFNDVSCNRALSTTYGDLHGATLHKQGNHKFVCFAGKTNFEVQFIIYSNCIVNSNSKMCYMPVYVLFIIFYNICIK